MPDGSIGIASSATRRGAPTRLRCGGWLPVRQVGTGIARPDETEPKEGRLLVLQYAQGKVRALAMRALGLGIKPAGPLCGLERSVRIEGPWLSPRTSACHAAHLTPCSPSTAWPHP